MVTLVREGLGWSQSDLAAAAQLSQSFISKVENGLIDLDGPRLEQVATALNCPASLLVDATRIQGLEVTCLHHRRRHSKMTAAKKRQVEAVTNLTRISVEGLLNGIDIMPEAHLHRIDIDAVGDPGEIARQLRVAWRVPSGPIADLTRLLEAVGVVMVQRTLGTNAQDAVSTWPHEQDRPPVMLVNTGLPADRYRFTVAHELGHLVMHALPRDTQEAEADDFAAEFLAPQEEIAPQLAGLTTAQIPRLVELKQQWGISVQALIRRAKDVDAISDRQYRQFMMRIGQLGWRTFEPGEIPAEHPRTLERVIATHREMHGYSHQDLAAAAVMLEEPFRRHYMATARATPISTLRVVRD